MNNSNKSKAAGLWVDRLFKQSGTSLTTHSSKTYFAHRYHQDPSDLDPEDFGTLFTDLGNKQPTTVQDHANYQKEFQYEAKLSRQDAKEGRPYWGISSYQCTVLNCYSETPDTKTFRLGIQDGDAFDYLPGQYVTLSIVIANQEYKRSYSLASSPGGRKILEITVKRAPNGGLVSNWLNDHVNMGDTLRFKGPFGKFSCTQHNPDKILFLAAGSGIVPIMSMLRWLAETEAPVDVRLLLSFRTPEDIIYREELLLIASRHKNIRLSISLTAETIEPSQWSCLTGRVDEKMINELVPDLPERNVYLCGPAAFMETCKVNLLKLKLPFENLFCESFTVNASPANQEVSCLSRPSRTKQGHFRIDFARSDKTMTADGCISLLELAEKSGISIGHECRSGQCGECMIKCLKGKVEMTEQVEIDDVDRKRGWVYACCAYPASHVLLDI